MVKLYDGPYRLTIVGDKGLTTTKKISKWSKAYTEYQSAIRMPHTRYAIIWELSEDKFHNEMREEWKRP